MAYYIKKSGALIPGDVYWTGGSNWSDDISKKNDPKVDEDHPSNNNDSVISKVLEVFDGEILR